MRPFFILNSELTLSDIQDALLEKFDLVQSMHSLLLFGCFDGSKLKVPEEILYNALWIMADLLKQIEILHLNLNDKI